MRRVLVHACVGGCLCVVLLLVAVGFGGRRPQADRRPPEPPQITRGALITVGVAVFFWPWMILAYAVGAMVGAGLGAARNGIDRHRARTAHRWRLEDD